MKGQRGKKAKHVVYAEKGLLEDSKWQRALKNYPTELVCWIRRDLAKNIRGLNEKFNHRSRYFGYWKCDDEDRLYIFVQKKRLQIYLWIDREYEKNVRKDGFEVHFVNNFQGRKGWLTGWQVPHNTENIETVMKWLCMAFSQ
jgi:hypothetical protein